MGELSERVMRDYSAEVEVIKEAGGSLWPKWIGMAIGVGAIWALSQFSGDSWSKRDICLGIIFVIAAPPLEQVWERHKVAAQMKHQREVRMELKLDALLGFIKIEDIECDD